MAACAACGQVNPEIARFCLACGAPVDSSRGRWARSARRSRCCFCDLVGFTAASDRADPEDVRARIRPCHARLRQVVEGFGGTVEKFIGDAVMAVFGAPVAHEDDPERAVRAGLRILEAIADLNAAVTARALLAEHHGQHAEAAALFTAAAERWERFEVPWEQAQALLVF